MAFDLKKLSKREKNIVGGLLLILACLPFFQFTLPAWNEYQTLNSTISDDKNRIRTLETQIKKFEKMKIQNIELSKKIEAQKLFLAKSYEIDFLVQDLKKICDESSISLESFTPISPEPINIILEKQVNLDEPVTPAAKGKKGKPTTKSERLKQTLDKLKGQEFPVDLYRFPIEVRVTGNFKDIVDLFKKLEKYGRVISVDNISIGKVQAKRSGGDRLSKAKKEEKTDTGTLFGTFDLIAYSLPDDKDETITIKDLQNKNKKSPKSFKFSKH